MASRYYLLKPCRTTPAFISTLKSPTRLDLKSCRRKLETAGFPTEDIEVMLLVGGEPEATLYESGKVLVRTSDAKDAQGRVDAIYAALGIRDAAA